MTAIIELDGAAPLARRDAISSEAIYYPLFDYVRAIAAIGVFVAHADKYHLFPAELGNASVQVFFALSGYLIGSILLRSQLQDMPRFYFNRATRIWIPYLLAILLLFIVTAAKQGLSDPKFGEFFFYMVTFVYNWFGPPQLAQFVHRMPLYGTANHFWSICVEEQFYLVAPLVLLTLNRSAAVIALSGVVAVNFWVPHYFAAISLGVLLAVANRAMWFASAAVIASAVSVYFLPYGSWMPLVAVSVVALAAQEGRPTSFGKIIGGGSYPFYLNHWVGLFVISGAVKIGLPYGAGAMVGFTVAVTIAAVHYLTVDRWIATHRTDWFTQRRGYLLCTAGFALVLVGLIFGLIVTGR